MARIVNVPRNKSVDDNLSIVVLERGDMADPSAPSAATLNGADDVTYEFTTDGWSPSHTQDTETDPRLALRDEMESPGATKHGLSGTWFYGHPDLKLDTLAKEGAELELYVRDSVPIETDFTAGATQTVDRYSILVGAVSKNRTTHGKQTKTAKFFVQSYEPDLAIGA